MATRPVAVLRPADALAAYIRRVVDCAPPPSPLDADRLRALLPATGTPTQRRAA